jgi:hypothetical protein
MSGLSEIGYCVSFGRERPFVRIPVQRCSIAGNVLIFGGAAFAIVEL